MPYLFDTILISFGGIFSFIWVIGASLSQNRKLQPPAVFILMTSGFRLCFEAAYFSGFMSENPIIYGISVPVLYSIGPSIYLFFCKFNSGSNDQIPLPVYFIPLFLSLTVLPFWFVLSEKEQLMLIFRIFHLQPNAREFIDWLFLFWVIGPKFLILFFSNLSAILILNELRYFSKNMKRDLKFFLFSFLTFLHIMILADIYGYLFSDLWIIRICAWSHSISVIIVYFFGTYQPKAILEFEISFEKRKYERSKIDNVDVDKIIANIEKCMMEEHFYADEDLRLIDLADACGISVHQLSEVLNQKMNTSFTDFVNKYRIKAAKDMLVNDLNRPILSIAMAVGFNSKSSFNRIFKKMTNLTPSEFQKQKLE
ncbi:helix-turn-helix domain-containing protein [Leptospira sp. 96542]|nr:helix-turn-helix domain-containing protein [Leptospira sp. 96542]